MEDFNLTFKQGSLIVSVSSLSFLVFNFISGGIISMLGRKKTCIIIGISFFLTALGLIFSPSFNFLIVTMVILGIGWGLNNNVGNILVSEYSGGSGYNLGLLHTAYAFGAFFIPLLITLFTRMNFGYKIPLIIILILSIVLNIMFLKIPLAEGHIEGKAEKPSFEFLKNPRYYVFICIFFLYVASETGINNFLITYLVDEKIVVKSAPLILSLFWGLMLVGRFFISHVSKHIKKNILLTVLGGGFFISFVLFMIFKNPVIVVIAIMLVGLFMAGIFPIGVANADSFVKGSGIESGIMFSCGGIGSAILPMVMGAIADKNGVRQSMYVVLLLAGLCFIFTYINYLMSKKETVKNKIEIKVEV